MGIAVLVGSVFWYPLSSSHQMDHTKITVEGFFGTYYDLAGIKHITLQNKNRDTDYTATGIKTKIKINWLQIQSL